MSPNIIEKSRMLGGLWGSLVGDALGVPVEFQDRASRVADPVTGMRAYGTHHQPAGTWSDDGALLLCSVESLAERGFDTQDMAQRFLRWRDEAHWTATGSVFDIGIATSRALQNISQGIPAGEAGGRDVHSNGNGSLMRILPVVLHALTENSDTFRDCIHRASAITHAHPRSQMACVYFGLLVRALMDGKLPADAHLTISPIFRSLYPNSPELGYFEDLMNPNLPSLPETKIQSGGYVMETLQASVWCLLTTKNFPDCVLKAVNLGSDTDTTACVAGALAGVAHGESAIPKEWRTALPRQKALAGLFDQFQERLSRKCLTVSQ